MLPLDERTRRRARPSEPRRGEAGPALPEPGAERTDEFDVTGPLLTDVGGTIGISVLSTPGMIG